MSLGSEPSWLGIQEVIFVTHSKLKCIKSKDFELKRVGRVVYEILTFDCTSVPRTCCWLERERERERERKREKERETDRFLRRRLLFLLLLRARLLLPPLFTPPPSLQESRALAPDSAARCPQRQKELYRDQQLINFAKKKNEPSNNVVCLPFCPPPKKNQALFFLNYLAALSPPTKKRRRSRLPEGAELIFFLLLQFDLLLRSEGSCWVFFPH